MNTQPYWCCGVCKKAVAPVGKGARQAMLEHRKQCRKAGFKIQQVAQGIAR